MPAPTGPTAHGNTMLPGQVLHVGDTLTSANGVFRLSLQQDGNLTLMTGTSAVVWSSGTGVKHATVVFMQPDGHLGIYDANGTRLWQSPGPLVYPGSSLQVSDSGGIALSQGWMFIGWSTGVSHVYGNSALIYRARFKRWTSVPFAGTKGNDVILVKIPPGATLQSVTIGPVDYQGMDPTVNSPIQTVVGDGSSGAQLTLAAASGNDAVAIRTHWWFDAFRASYYSISVWVTGPDPMSYPIEESGDLHSANMDAQIRGSFTQWFANNQTNLIIAAGALAAACIDIATLGTGAAVTTPVLIAAISAAVAAGAKIAITPTKT